MKSSIFIFLAFVTFSIICTVSVEAETAQVFGNYGDIPLAFTANRGRLDSQVAFTTHGNGCTMFFTPQGTTYLLRKETEESIAWRKAKENDPKSFIKHKNLRDEIETESFAFKLNFLNANPNPEIAGEDQLPWNNNYFLGNDPSKWETDVPNYRKIRFRDVYDGIDLVYHGNNNGLKYDFVVKPGKNPSDILLTYDLGNISAASLAVNTVSELVVSTPLGDLIEREPYCYQIINGKEVEVAARYNIIDKGKNTFTIEVDAYDNDYELIIDPELGYSTFLGTSQTELGFGIDIDSSGNAYVTGSTAASWFPITAGSFDTTYNGYDDVIVTKINPSGSALIYSTFIGGNEYNGDGYDHGYAIAVDSSGNAYITGTTESEYFPHTSGYYHGCTDVFVTKLNSAGNGILYSIIIGNDLYDYVSGIAIDNNGNAWITGETENYNFPITYGTYDTSFNGAEDIFVTKLNSSGSIEYSTFIGTSGSEDAGGIDVDASGNVYITGTAHYPPYPTTLGAYDRYYGGDSEVFVTKFNSTLSSLVYSTLIGGYSDEHGNGIVIDSSGNAYITGYCWTGYPTTSGAYDETHSTWDDAFVTKLNASGTALLYSTYLGGTGIEAGLAIDIDSYGKACVTGYTTSTDFPTTPNAYDFSPYGQDVFVTKLNSTGSALEYSTYLGGSYSESGYDIVVDDSDNAYVTGTTYSTNYPTTVGAYDTSFNGNNYQRDIFITKLAVEYVPVGTVAGTITDYDTGLGVNLATVTVIPGNYSDQTDSNGYYIIPQVPAGSNYSMTVTKTGYYENGSSYVNVIEGQTTTKNLFLVPIVTEGTVDGTITDATTSTGVANVTVTVNPGNHTDLTDAYGNYSVEDITEGSGYTVTATKQNYYQNSQSGVTVTAGQSTVVNLTLTRQEGTVAGTITDYDTGLAIDSVMVYVNPGSFAGMTNSNGYYSIPNIPFNTGYTVTATEPAYVPNSQENVTVTAGQTTTVNLTLALAPGIIAGTITDSDTGGPIQSAIVTVYPGVYSDTTDVNGLYEISDLFIDFIDSLTVSASTYENRKIERLAISGDTLTVDVDLSDNWLKLKNNQNFVLTHNSPLQVTLPAQQSLSTGDYGSFGSSYDIEYTDTESCNLYMMLQHNYSGGESGKLLLRARINDNTVWSADITDISANQWKYMEIDVSDIMYKSPDDNEESIFFDIVSLVDNPGIAYDLNVKFDEEYIYILNNTLAEGNFIPVEFPLEDYRQALVEKFLPCIQLDKDDDGLTPKPIEIIGADNKANLYYRVHNNQSGVLIGDFPHSECPLFGWHIDKTSSKKIKKILAAGRLWPIEYNGRGSYTIQCHWEWGSPENNTPESWRNTYASKTIDYPGIKVYANLWQEPGPSTTTYIQYWFFYPYNDWLNNHEGDWERITIKVNSPVPESAQIQGIGYGFHHYWLKLENEDLAKCFIIDNTHPVVFAGGEGDEVFAGIPAHGPSGHGSFPMPGLWEDVGPELFKYFKEDIPDEEIENTGEGRFIHYSDSDIEVEIIYQTDHYTFWNDDLPGPDNNMAWLKSGLVFGHYNVDSPGSVIETSILNQYGQYKDVGNTPPKSPAHNCAWFVWEPNTIDGNYLFEDIPYQSASLSGWEPRIYYPPTGLQYNYGYASIQEALNGAKSGMTVYLQDDISIDSDLNIPNGVCLTIANGVEITFAETQQGTNFGGDATRCELVIQDSASLKMETTVKLTSSGVWGGIYLYDGGNITLSGGCTIENARFGIFMNGSITLAGQSGNDININNCEVEGIRITDCSPSIEYISFSECNCGIGIYGAASYPSLTHVNINGTTTDKGLVSSAYAQPDLDNSVINENVISHKIFVYQNGNLDIDYGHNDIYDDANSYAVYLSANSSNIDARENHWGEYEPPDYYLASNIFSDPSKVTDWSSANPSPYNSAGKIAAIKNEAQENPFKEAFELEKTGDVDGALNSLKNIIRTTSEKEIKQKAIRSIYRINLKNDSDYEEVTRLIEKELSTATSTYKAVLDYLLCDISARKGIYEEAIEAFSEKAGYYKETSMEVDMLIRIACIHGNCLGDKKTALLYAEKAQQINPGHATLLDAYASAGIAYEPWNFENKFFDSIDNFNSLPEYSEKPLPENDTDVTEYQEFVFVSPNPFNPLTTFTYSINETSPVRIDIYSITGQKIVTLVDDVINPGTHTVNFDGSNQATGVYLYRFVSNNLTKTGRLLLVK